MTITPASAAGGAKNRAPRPVARATSDVARALPVVVPVAAAGTAVTVAAAWSLVAARPSLGTLAGILALLVAAAFVEAFPVPVEGSPAGGTSVAAVFVVGAAVLYGWTAGALVGCLAAGLIQVLERQGAPRLAFNSSVYALGGAAAGAAATRLAGSGEASVLAGVIAGALAFFVVNIVLTTAVVSRWASKPFWPLLRGTIYWTALPFAGMASVTLMLEVLWHESALYALALIGPLLTIALYQRSVRRALAATRLALTDELTGLGNLRSFHDRLARALEDAAATGTDLTLCLVDLDDLKGVNDRFGHPVGDAVIEQVADALRRHGQAFRLGGDEFALLLARTDEHSGRAVAAAAARAIGAARFPHDERVTVSVGMAAYPSHALDPGELVWSADRALYRAKREGKNTQRLHEATPAPAEPLVAAGRAG